MNNCTKKISDVPPRNAIELHNSTPGPLILVPSTNELEIVGRRWRDADCRLVAAIPERVKGRHVIILAKDTDEDRARAEAALTEALISGAEHGRVVSLPGWGGRYPKFSAWCDHYSLEAAVHGNQGRILPNAPDAPAMEPAGAEGSSDDTAAGGDAKPRGRRKSHDQTRRKSKKNSNAAEAADRDTVRMVNESDAEPEPATPAPYRVEGGRICRVIEGRGGDHVLVPVCNFAAIIVEQITYDDGAEQRRRLRIEGSRAEGGDFPAIEISAEEFMRGEWPLMHWGCKAVVSANAGAREHVRAAVQTLSSDLKTRTVYGHTGWRSIADEWVYLHAGGAIGPDGPVEDIQVNLPPALERYTLPEPPERATLIKSVQETLDIFRGLGPDSVIFPLLATVYRAVLPGADSTLHLSGLTGTGKTELAALAQQHFGPGMDARHLPASWSSTGNSLEAIGFIAKDAVLVVDDFCPVGAQSDIARAHRDADRVVRAQGNLSGRQRLRADGELRPVKPPRGTIVSTGEDIPLGHSLRARMLVIEVGPGDVNFSRLSECQILAAAGAYARAMAGYIAWIAPQFDKLVAHIKADTQHLRDGVGEAAHRRTKAGSAALIAGFDLFLEFAVETGAVNLVEAENLRRRCRDALEHRSPRAERSPRRRRSMHEIFRASHLGTFIGRCVRGQSRRRSS